MNANTDQNNFLIPHQTRDPSMHPCAPTLNARRPDGANGTGEHAVHCAGSSRARSAVPRLPTAIGVDSLRHRDRQLGNAR